MSRPCAKLRFSFAFLAKMVCSLRLHKISAVVLHAELVPITLLDVMGTSDTKTRKFSSTFLNSYLNYLINIRIYAKFILT